MSATYNVMLIVWAVFVLVCLGIGLWRMRVKEQNRQELHPVSKRRLKQMWVVDEDNDSIIKVVPKLPKRTEVQLYDEEQGKSGWLE